MNQINRLDTHLKKQKKYWVHENLEKITMRRQRPKGANYRLLLPLGLRRTIRENIIILSFFFGFMKRSLFSLSSDYHIEKWVWVHYADFLSIPGKQNLKCPLFTPTVHTFITPIIEIYDKTFSECLAKFVKCMSKMKNRVNEVT